MQINQLFRSQSNAVFLVIAGLGLIISTLVYVRGEQIVDALHVLVNEQMPIHDDLRQLNLQMAEQERYLYEYYATVDEKIFQQQFIPLARDTSFLIQRLQPYFLDIYPIQEITKNVTDIQTSADLLFLDLAEDAGQWDQARIHLQQISDARREAEPALKKLIELTQNAIVLQKQVAEQNTLNVRYLVIAYSIGIAILVFMFARAIRAYVHASSDRERLSLFPSRNPNPIISLDRDRNVVYSNPATARLMTKLGLPEDNVNALLDEKLTEHQDDILANSKHAARFEYDLQQRTIEYELHWLDDQKQWDLHLTDITDRKLAERKLKYQASHHPDTGLLNEYQLITRLEYLAEKDTNLTLGLVQIVNYGNLVSLLGVEGSKRVTRQIGATIEDTLSSMFECPRSVYHLGEKTFAVLLESSPAKRSMQHFLQQCRDSLSGGNTVQRFQMQLHCGVVQAIGEASDIIRNVHIALEKAIESDIALPVFYSDELGQQVHKAQMRVIDMRHALQQDQFELYFQPQADINTQKMIGAEVLIRWFKDGEFISPGEFIPLAEKSGMIIPLGDWILRKACEQGVQMLNQAQNPFVIAVNISPKQFAEPGFLDKVKQVLEQTGMPPHLLELEITEGATMHNEMDTISLLHSLHELGVMLSIDDFGTGYSSLSYLSRFPLHKLKIDQSFVRHLHTDQTYLSIVHSVIELGKSLGLTLIAEGVEEDKQVSLLAGMGCQEIQGYLYSKPLPYETFCDFFKQQESTN